MTVARNIEVLREAISRIARTLSGQGITVTQRGAKAYVEWKNGKPVRVVIPELPDNATEELVVAINGFLDHEVAHLLFTDANALGKWTKKRRDGDLKGRADAWNILDALQNTVEDTYIERQMGKRYLGSVHNLGSTRQFIIDRRLAPLIKQTEANPAANADSWFAILIAAAVRAAAGQKEFIALMTPQMWERMGKHGEIIQSLAGKIQSVASSKDACDVADEIFQRMIEEKRKEQQEQKRKDKEEQKRRDEEQKRQEQDDQENGVNPDGENPEGCEDKEGDPGEQQGEPEPGGEGEGDEPDDCSGDEPSDEDGDAGGNESEGQSEPTEDESDEEGDADDGQPGEDGDEDGDADADEGDDEGQSGPTEGDSEEEDGDEDGDADADEGKPSEPSDEEGDDEGMTLGSTESDEDSDADGTEDQEGDGGGRGGDGAMSTQSDTEEEADGGDPDTDADEVPPMPAGMLSSKESFDEQMAQELSKLAASLQRNATYTPYTRELDYIGPLPPISNAAPPLTDLSIYKRATKEGAVLEAEIQRAFVARSAKHWQPGLRKGQVNRKALARLSVGDDRIFRQRIESQTKSVAASLLVDFSGSMHEYTKLGDAATGAYIFASALSRLNVPNEVAAFTTMHDYTRAVQIDEAYAKKISDYISHVIYGSEARGFQRIDPLAHYVIKDFKSPMNTEVRRQIALLGGFEAGSYRGLAANNIDGEAVRIAAMRLMQQKVERRVLVVFSDGQPYGSGDPRAMQNDLLKAIAEVTAAGIEVHGFGLMNPAVATYYKSSVLVKDTKELPARVLDLIRMMVR